MDYSLLLLSGGDIPFYGGQAIIHQPKIKEIAYIGQENFFIGCEFLNFSKNKLPAEDKVHLENKTNFDIIMSMIMQQEMDKTVKHTQESVLQLLSLLFPGYTVEFGINQIIFFLDDIEEVEENRKIMFTLSNDNYEEFRKLLSLIFCFTSSDSEKEFNPSGDMAQKIAEKLRKGRAKVAAMKNQKEPKKRISVFDRYISILAVGEQKDINELMNYTVYQLFDEFQRYELKLTFDSYLSARMAGAQDLEEVDNWMKDIHE